MIREIPTVHHVIWLEQMTQKAIAKAKAEDTPRNAEAVEYWSARLTACICEEEVAA